METLTGVVMGNSGSKSIKVAINFKVRHPKYGKYVKRQTRLGVHDEHNQAGTGDLVEIVECRPYSRTKKWRLLRILQKAVKE